MENQTFDPILNQYQTNTAKIEKQNNFVTFDEKNYLNTKLSSSEQMRETKIRFLSLDKDSKTPFGTIFTHFIKVNGEWKSVPCNKKTVENYKTEISNFESNLSYLRSLPKNDETDWNIKNVEKTIENYKKQIEEYSFKYGCECPICEVAYNAYLDSKKATTESERKALLDISKSYNAMKTYVCRVIEKGKENEGPKFWKFNHSFTGKGIYDSLIDTYRSGLQDKINIFDLYNGCDITIKIQRNQHGKSVVTNNVIASRGTSRIGSDEQIDSWVNDPKTWVDVYKPRSYEYSEILLNGDVPVFDKQLNKYVGQKELKAQEYERNNAIKEEEERLNNEYSNFNQFDSNSSGDDLPF